MFDLCRYKTLDADEAEERYAQRGKIINKWAMMVNRKLKPGEEVGEEDPDGDEVGSKKAKKKDLKISDMEEWEDEGDALDTSEDEKDNKDDYEAVPILTAVWPPGGAKLQVLIYSHVVTVN